MFERNLKYYRLKNNMTKKQLAEKCGISPMAISNYEKGLRKPDMDIVNKLAKNLNIKVADFLSPVMPDLVFNHAEFRKTSKVTAIEQEYIKSSVENYFNRFFNAVDCIPEDVLAPPVVSHLIDSTKDSEKDAKAIRKLLGFNDKGPIRNIVLNLENRGILVFNLDIQNKYFSGINGTVNNYIYIAFNKNMTYERQRFTIAHELVHAVLKVKLDSNREIESYVNAVAGSFLIGKEDLFRELGIRRSKISYDMKFICEEFGISLATLVMRANSVGIMSNSFKKSFFINYNKEKYRNVDTVNKDKSVEPHLFDQIVYRGISENEISINKACELLALPYEVIVNNLKNFEEVLYWIA